MRHHRRAQNADGDEEHLRVLDDFKFWHKAAHDGGELRAGENYLGQKTSADEQDECDDQRFDVTKAFVLEKQNHQHIQRGEAHTPDERQTEQQIERDGRADDFRKVAGADGDFTQHPQTDRHGFGVMIAAGLREVASRHDAELGAEGL